MAEAEARAALDRLVALGLPCERGAAGERHFDLAEVANFLVWAGSNLGDPTFAQHCVVTAKRLVLEAYGTRSGDERGTAPSLDELGARRYAMTLRRSYNLRDHAPGRRVRLRLPVPIEDLALGELQVEFHPPVDMACETSSGLGRLDVIVPVPSAHEITIGITAQFTARPSPPAASSAVLDPAERELYTRPTEGLIRTSERVETLARQLAGAAHDTESTVERFWSFFLSELGAGYVHHEHLDPARPLDTVLEQGWFDCKLGSALMVALCRARGIPARIVSGYLIYPSAPSNHTWLEVWFEGSGWRPFDLFGWGLGEDRIRGAGWHDYFYGRVDHRAVTERPPLIFAGTGSVRMPRAWDMLNYAEGNGSVTEIFDGSNGNVVYREYAEVEALSDPE